MLWLICTILTLPLRIILGWEVVINEKIFYKMSLLRSNTQHTNNTTKTTITIQRQNIPQLHRMPPQKRMDTNLSFKTREYGSRRKNIQQETTIRWETMKGQRFKKRMSDKMTIKNEYALSSNETVNIIPLGDFHIGSSEFNYEFFDYMLKQIKKLKNRRIYLMGDLLESASKHVGNSSFHTHMSLEEQKESLLESLGPFQEDIIGVCVGNHEARLIKEFDFNVVADIARELGCQWYNQNIDRFKINEHTIDVFTRHGKGTSGQRHLSMGKLERSTNNIQADIYLEGHNHRLLSWNKFYVDKTGLHRKYYGYSGAFLNYGGSYAESMYLDVEPPAYQTISINKNKRIKFNQHFCDLETDIKFM